LGNRTYVIDGKSFDVEVLSRSARDAEVAVNGKRYRVELQSESAPVPAHTAGGASGPRPRRAAPAEGELRAPMAGLILRVDVAPGQRLEAGDPVLVLDAMKMENSIRAPHAGVVQELAVTAGQSVLTGALLARIHEPRIHER